jgi:hypothetical protein
VPALAAITFAATPDSTRTPNTSQTPNSTQQHWSSITTSLLACYESQARTIVSVTQSVGINSNHLDDGDDDGAAARDDTGDGDAARYHRAPPDDHDEEHQHHHNPAIKINIVSPNNDGASSASARPITPKPKNTSKPSNRRRKSSTDLKSFSRTVMMATKQRDVHHAAATAAMTYGKDVLPPIILQRSQSLSSVMVVMDMSSSWDVTMSQQLCHNTGRILS